jgi:regulator-associated protein of mTOR
MVVSVWDWSHRKRLNYFCNGNPKGTSITSIHIINQDVGGIIVTGSGMDTRLFSIYNLTLKQLRALSASIETMIRPLTRVQYKWSALSAASMR